MWIFAYSYMLRTAYNVPTFHFSSSFSELIRLLSQIGIMNKVLFVCIHNSARSQIAEALMRRECGDAVHVQSAGLTPGPLNPLAVEVLEEIGIDISDKQTRDVFDLFKTGTLFSHVITVCDEASAQRCPIFPGPVKRLQWSFSDPSTFQGSHEERLAQTRVVRDEIAERVMEFCAENCIVLTHS